MSTQVSIPGYVAGTWVIDAAHSDVAFQVRMMGFVKVRGTFDDFQGTIVLAPNPLDSSVNVVIKTGSVRTKNKKRDEHLHHDDFLNVEQHPTMTFTSTGVRPDGDRYLVDGDLTIRAITKQVTLSLEPKGFDAGSDGTPAARFAASTQIICTDFGVTRGKAAIAVSDKDEISLDITAHKQG
jgi:polyisoprenoid-binding protein YceI